MGRSEVDKAFALIAIRLKRHIDSLGPSATDTPVKKRVWNSLEAAKIFVGILTSISVAALGYIITTTNTDRQFEYEKSLRKEASDRDKEVRKEVRDHQDKLVVDARAADARAREEAAIEATRASNEAFARELVLKKQLDHREAAARAESRSEARLSKLHDKRIQAWERIGPSAAQMLKTAGRITTREMRFPGDLLDLREAFQDDSEEFLVLSNIQSAYFTPWFQVESLKMLNAIIDFQSVASKRDKGEATREDIDKAYGSLQEAHNSFTLHIEKELRLEGESGL